MIRAAGFNHHHRLVRNRSRGSARGGAQRGFYSVASSCHDWILSLLVSTMTSRWSPGPYDFGVFFRRRRSDCSDRDRYGGRCLGGSAPE
jgi:hypothetical protein